MVCFTQLGARRRNAGLIWRSFSHWHFEQIVAAIGVVGFANYPDAPWCPASSVTHLRSKSGGPLVGIAQGFAGSHQVMEDMSLLVARAGNVGVIYDLAGLGSYLAPMSVDVSVMTGTMQLLMDERDIVEPFGGIRYRGATIQP